MSDLDFETNSASLSSLSPLSDARKEDGVELSPSLESSQSDDILSHYNSILNEIRSLESKLSARGEYKEVTGSSLGSRVSSLEEAIKLHEARSSKSPSTGGVHVPLSAKRKVDKTDENKNPYSEIEIDDHSTEDGVVGLDEHGQKIYKLEHYFAMPLWRILRTRLPWLMGLLLLQSFSASIIGGFEDLLKDHFIVALYIPMLVGTGGNAGNQPGVMVTRALSNRELQGSAVPKLLKREFFLAVITATLMGTLGFCRVMVTDPDPVSAFAISMSLFLVVMTAIFLGIGFSILLDRCGVDPAAGAAPLLTTIADLVGITLLCIVSLMVFGS
jgi:cation transporter-like permease